MNVVALETAFGEADDKRRLLELKFCCATPLHDAENLSNASSAQQKLLPGRGDAPETEEKLGCSPRQGCSSPSCRQTAQTLSEQGCSSFRQSLDKRAAVFD